MKIETFFDKITFTLTYVVYDPTEKDAVIIDPVLNFDLASGKISHESASEIIDFVLSQSLNVVYILETHAHADHLTAAPYLKQHFPGAKVGIGEKIKEVQKTFASILNFESGFPCDGSQFDILFKNGDVVKKGSMTFEVFETPGHTPACLTYRFEDCLFTGDCIFMPDSGTGRSDFPGGDAEQLYRSIMKLYDLPEHYLIYVGHDYQPKGRELKFSASIAEQKKTNIHLTSSTQKEEFVSMRRARDSSIGIPRLLYPSIQINIRGGHFPPVEINGTSYLKIPLTDSLVD